MTHARPMVATVDISIEEVGRAAAAVAERHRGKARNVYGVPRGGITPAAMVAGMLNIPIVSQGHLRPTDTLIVDDLVDSGATLAPWVGGHFTVDALFRKSHSPIDLAPDAIVKDGWLVFPWEKSSTGPEDAIVRLLEFIGEDPTREGLVDTPARVTRAFAEMTSGYRVDVGALFRVFTEPCDEMVVVRGIDFSSLCEHHLLPFTGTASIGYVPDGRVVGLSKLPRLVDAFAHRLQVQERMTTQIAAAIEEHLEPLGVGVVIEARHSCMSCRGVRKSSTEMVTSAMLGVFREKPEARAEFLAFARSGVPHGV